MKSFLGFFGVADRSGKKKRTGSDEATGSYEIPALPVDVSALTDGGLQASMDAVANEAGTWDKDAFRLVKTLQDAKRNQGRVDLMVRSDNDKEAFAVKRMPTAWVRNNASQFAEAHPRSSERPWSDLGLVRHLNVSAYPYACDLAGVYRDDLFTYVLTSLASEGDLFGWCDREPRPGPDREVVMMPLVCQIFTAVRWLHELGIAHRDLSLENILLTEEEPGGPLKVKIIDFGMATLSQICRKELRGKASYQAPEMHTEPEYDAFLCDAFATGVVVFAMAAQDYPWTTTKRNQCQLFEYVSMYGFRKFLSKRKLRRSTTGQNLGDVMSQDLVELLEGLLQVQSRSRFCLGERYYYSGAGINERRSVWETRWVQEYASLEDEAGAGA